jgi:transcription antitermination protein NusB
MRERSRARGWALQALYAWEMRGGEPDRIVPVLAELVSERRVSPQNRLYAEILVRLTAQNLSRIDATIGDHLTNWSMKRLSTIDRNVLRLGVAELMFVDEVPSRVTIREMLRLAEHFGTDDSPRFVNGVLDAVQRTIQGGAGGA